MPRALTEVEINKKESLILANAFKLFETTTFKSFRMEDLSSLCKMSKGILFKYFKTKKILFLRMLEKKYEEVLLRIDKAISKRDEMSKEEFKEFLLETFKRSLNYRSSYLRLLALKGNVLSEESDYDFTYQNRKLIHDYFLEFIQNVMFQVNSISMDDLKEIIAYQEMLFIGYMNTVHKDQVIKNVVEDANLEIFLVDHRKIAIKAFRAYLDTI